MALGPFGPIRQPVLAILHTQINTTILQTGIISTNNAVSQSCYKCGEISELNFFLIHGYKFDEGLFSNIYLCKLRLKQGREIQDFMF